ncbi:MAG: DNA-directed RNA polymerase subunit alpha C-terminal domain-containing protein [Bacteroidales bacterium]
MGLNRVGQRTDYDRLQLEVWTDGRMTPEEALRNATKILQGHLTVFTQAQGESVAGEMPLTEEEQKLFDKMCSDVADLDLSVRAKNCLHNAGVQKIGELVQKSENEMLKFRNFGKKSLEEIADKLTEMGLGLGMDIPENVLANFQEKVGSAEPQPEESSESKSEAEEKDAAKESKESKKTAEEQTTETEKE